MTILAHAIAYVVLAGALIATAIALNNRQYPATKAPKSWPSLATTDPDAELARCRAIGLETADAGGCKAVWEANRKRFLQSGKLYQDRLIDAVPAIPDSNQGSASAGHERPDSPARSATHSSPHRSVDITGQPK